MTSRSSSRIAVLAPCSGALTGRNDALGLFNVVATLSLNGRDSAAE